VADYRGWWRTVVILVTDPDVHLKVETFLHYFATVSLTKPVIHIPSIQMDG